LSTELHLESSVAYFVLKSIELTTTLVDRQHERQGLRLR
jgi:hypothetical protein